MRHLLVLLLTLVLSSCFDVKEEVWVHRDGSGDLALVVHLPHRALQLAGGNEALENAILEWFQSTPQLELSSLDILPPTPPSEDTTVQVRAHAPSLRVLSEISESIPSQTFPSMPNLAGTFQIDLSIRGVDFHRQVNYRQALGLAALAISSDQRQQRHLETRIHLPTRATTSNADEILDQGRTLVWHRSLGDALTRPTEMTFHAPLPLPLGWLACLSGLGLLLAGGLSWRRLRRRP
ncbi:hypothetical protein HNR46_001547 [Haloferula luteola]|uniref:DUF3153 domain-containing protein n=1 Tax=Haloferula luteola TaxID=595692 RepID=A0A840VER3_9BACT|nr:hypothetical protein [Haloferula luteola]MBB5351311.1 hypothetical protein [Haloferula luteola]